MPLVGDFATLAEWERAIGELGKKEFRRDVAGDMSFVARQDIDEGFTKEQDPFGRPWEPKKRPNGFKILEGETKNLRHDFSIEKVNEEGFKIKSKTPYFRPHQDGARGRGSRANWRLPRRQMIAEGNPLPPKLARKLGDVYRKHILLKLK